MHRYSKPILVADPVFGAVAMCWLSVHDRADCKGQKCALHNPSPHHMRTWTKVVRLDKIGLVERLCGHGVGHPDPDSLAYYARTLTLPLFKGYALGSHGCDGCCRNISDDTVNT